MKKKTVKKRCNVPTNVREFCIDEELVTASEAVTPVVMGLSILWDI